MGLGALTGRFRRAASPVLICLLIGLVANFAAPAIWVHLGVRTHLWLVHDYGRRPWPHDVPADWPADCEMVEHHRTLFTDTVGLSVPEGFGKRPDATGNLPVGSQFRSYGWPCRSIQSWDLMWDYPPPIVSNSYPSAGFGVTGRVPYLPLFPGVAVNTACYATILAVLWWGLIRWPRTSAKRAGRCERCQYSLEGLPCHVPCPECGSVRGARPQTQDQSDRT